IARIGGRAEKPVTTVTFFLGNPRIGEALNVLSVVVSTTPCSGTRGPARVNFGPARPEWWLRSYVAGGAAGTSRSGTFGTDAVGSVDRRPGRPGPASRKTRVLRGRGGEGAA